MKKHFLLFFVIILQACTQPQESSNNNIAKVESGLINRVYLKGDSTWTIEDRMEHYGVPGVSIAVIKDNKIDWVKSYGVMDKETNEPVTTKTLFQAGSISKPVAAYGALRLADHGKINLDENVNTYLRSWQLPDNEFTNEKKVVLKHLLSHTGGVTVHGFLGYSPDLPVPSLLEVLEGTHPPANSPAIRVDKIPEASYRYSGGGYCIMQQMLIDLEGKPFPQIMNEQVLQPLQMTSSTYNQPLNEAQLKFAATGYLPDGTMTKGKRHTYPEMAAAGLWSTAEDLAKFAIDLQMTLKGESTTVLSKEMATKMTTPFVDDFIGLGIFLDKIREDVYFEHGGWDEGFSSHLIAHRDKGYGVVVLTNSNHPQFISELIRSVALAYNWGNYVPVYKKMEMDASSFPAIIGRYHNGSDGLISIFNEGNRLFMRYIRGEATELFKISDSTYVRRENDQVIQFKVNPDDEKLNILFSSDVGKPAELVNARMQESEKKPYEYLLAGDFDRALKEYQILLKTNPKDRAIDEGNLNRQGYDLMRSDKTKLAQDIFKINMILYPGSPNVYDSYAEACMKIGDTDLAIINYKKALSMDPKNTKAVKMLEELQKK
ncbi:MAG: serine hydrolase [Cyclobacteriaceae bacterium]|nr:serine hydrolase [Cyclobacteriaceae bacterium]